MWLLGSKVTLEVSDLIEAPRVGHPYLLYELPVSLGLPSLLLGDPVENSSYLSLSVAVGTIVSTAHYTTQQLKIVAPNLVELGTTLPLHNTIM